jgi:hypothetical protein
MKELRGDDIVAVDGRIGVLDDLYIDGERWDRALRRGTYRSWLRGRRLLLPAQLVGTPARAGAAILVALTRKDAHNSPGLGAAIAHSCSASQLLGHVVVGYDAVQQIDREQRLVRVALTGKQIARDGRRLGYSRRRAA